MCLTPGRLLAISVLLATQTAFGQLTRSLAPLGSVESAPWISPSRLLAGLRAYPSDQVRAFFVLVEYPGVLRQLADQPQLFEQPDAVKGVLSVEVAAAIRELRTTPGIVLVAAAHPAELEALRNICLEAPEGVQQRLQQLRENYRRLTAAAAAAWQKRLAEDPVALGQYRELLTRFCEEQRQAIPAFPCVKVVKREYYYTCVPDEAILRYAREECRASPLHVMLEKWWAYYRPERIDARAQGPGWDYSPRASVPDSTPEELKGLLEWYRSAARGVGEVDAKGAMVPAPPRTVRGAEVVAALPAEQRASMWRAAGAADSDVVGLIPVVIQPLADQPPEARHAYAVAEHARLWSFRPRPDVLAGPPEDDGAGGDVEAVPPEGAAEEQPVAEGVGPWQEMKQVGVRAAPDPDQRTGWRTCRSCYDRSGYYYGGVRLHYGGYGGYWDYSWLGWPYTRSDLQKLRMLYDITPGGWRSDIHELRYGYGGRTYIESGGVRVRVGPTTYYYPWPSSSQTRDTMTDVGVRRHYRSAAQRMGRGLRRYPAYGGSISGAQRRSANQPARAIRRVPQRFGARGPTVIRHGQPSVGSSRSSLDRQRRTGQTGPRAGLQRRHELRRSQHGARSSSSRGRRR